MCSDERSQVFHVISRVVDRNFIFEEEEKGQFLGSMRRLEAFSGVEVLSYCLMGNHFHLLLHVPARPEEISDDEVRERMQKLYGEKKMKEIENQMTERKEMGDEKFQVELFNRMRKRMYNLSSYVRDLKLRFSKWYNRKYDRKGTLWEERFKSVLVEPEEDAMMRVASYIELNSVRAELVSQPHEYNWCSYTEAVAGGKLARAGIMKVVSGLNGKMDWEKAARIYRSHFLHKAAGQNSSKTGMSQEEYQEAMKSGGDLSEGEIQSTRLRYLTEGAVLGSKEFLESFLESNKDHLNKNRVNSGFKMEKGPKGLFAYRQTR